jgi:hypothetical protein
MTFLAIATATITILIRCTFRVAELSEGFGGKLANDEPLFMIFDGLMMLICVAVLTVAHPGIMLGRRWDDGAFHWSRRGQENSDSEGSSDRSMQYDAGMPGAHEKVARVESREHHGD